MLESLAKEIIVFLGGVRQTDLTFPEARFIELKNDFVLVAGNTGVPASLLAAIAWTESDLVVNATNSVSRASGLMQVMPLHFTTFGLSANPYDPYKNVTAGARILLQSGYGKKSFRQTMQNYNGLVSVNDAAKVKLFETYYKRIAARWAYLNGTGKFL